MSDTKFEEWYLKNGKVNDIEVDYINYVDCMQMIGMEPLEKKDWSRLYFEAMEERKKVEGKEKK